MRDGRVGWPEVAVGLGLYLVVMVLVVVWYAGTSDEQSILRVNLGGVANGVAGVVALLAACLLRIRDLRAFGLRATSRGWMVAGAGLGVAAFAGSFLVEGLYFLVVEEPNTQADFQAAAKGGLASLALLLLTGAILTPLGEELVFRGIVATALNRHGAWAGVVGSAAIFGAVHGPSVIFFDAFMVGVLTGLLLRRTGSLWPCLATHVTYNALHLLHYSVA